MVLLQRMNSLQFGFGHTPIAYGEVIYDVPGNKIQNCFAVENAPRELDAYVPLLGAPIDAEIVDAAHAPRDSLSRCQQAR